jgi:hypothetical protein
VYYHNCGEYVTGQVALWCRRARAEVPFSVASDRDRIQPLPDCRCARKSLSVRLRLADAVIAN